MKKMLFFLIYIFFPFQINIYFIAGHYLHLPVTTSDRTPIGLVDVLQLVMATLKSVNSLSSEEAGPVWNQFWASDLVGSKHSLGSSGGGVNELIGSGVSGHGIGIGFTGLGGSKSDRGSVISTEGVPPAAMGVSQNHTTSQLDLFHSNSSDIHTHPLSPPQQQQPQHQQQQYHIQEHNDAGTDVTSNAMTVLPVGDFVFKYRPPGSSRIVRFSSPCNDFAALVSNVKSKGYPPNEEFIIRWLDDEGDYVQLTCDEDLKGAIDVAKREGWGRVLIFGGQDELPKGSKRRHGGEFKLNIAHGSNGSNNNGYGTNLLTKSTITTVAVISMGVVGAFLLGGLWMKRGGGSLKP